MNKPLLIRRCGRAALFAVPLMILMMGGAFAGPPDKEISAGGGAFNSETGSSMQLAETKGMKTRPRTGQRPFFEGPPPPGESYVIECPVRNSLKINLQVEEEMIFFQVDDAELTGDLCLCMEDAAIAKKAATQALKDMASFLSGTATPSPALKTAMEKAVYEIRNLSGKERGVEEWFERFGFVVGMKFPVSPPPGGSKSKSVYCYKNTTLRALLEGVVGK